MIIRVYSLQLKTFFSQVQPQVLNSKHTLSYIIIVGIKIEIQSIFCQHTLLYLLNIMTLQRTMFLLHIKDDCLVTPLSIAS